jgi:nicotinamide riboside transporter PnuC
VIRRRFSLLGLIYVLVGIYVAWADNYIGIRLIKLVLSALLAIFLWPLVLLGVDLRIH